MFLEKEEVDFEDEVEGVGEGVCLMKDHRLLEMLRSAVVLGSSSRLW